MNLRLALTGGIGSGKSTVAAAFKELGATIVDADAIARAVVARGTPGFDAVVARFGEQIVGPEGELDRPALGAIVFADESARRDLNAIVHPAVREEAARQISEAQAGDPRAITIEDIPLLAETAGAVRFHAVIVVRTSEDIRIERLLRRGMQEGDARARMRAQASDEQRASIADILIDNDGSAEELKHIVRELWEHRIQPFSVALATTTPPANWVRAASGISAASAGAIERARNRLEHYWAPHNGAVSAAEGGPAALGVRIGQRDAHSSEADVMAAAGFVLEAPGRYVSGDPFEPVLVVVEYSD